MYYNTLKKTSTISNGPHALLSAIFFFFYDTKTSGERTAATLPPREKEAIDTGAAVGTVGKLDFAIREPYTPNQRRLMYIRLRIFIIL